MSAAPRADGLPRLDLAAPLYFVRHGETDWNAEGRLQGGRDVPLNALGRVQAEEAGRRLRAQVGAALDGFDFVASPLGRTRETMAILRRVLGLPPDAYRADARLREIAFGGWEGLTWRDVRRRDPAGLIARDRDRWNFVPPGGESYADLARRIAPAVAVARETVMVAHGGVARALLVLATGLAPEEAPTVDVWQGRVLVIEDGAARWV